MHVAQNNEKFAKFSQLPHNQEIFQIVIRLKPKVYRKSSLP